MSLFEAQRSFDLKTLRASVRELATEGIFLGTSSWKYPGWLGQLYDRDRYETRGKFSQARFNKECLEEYATVFPTVSVDAAYYNFPTEKYAQGLAALVPPGFEFGFKVTDDITVKRFPKIPRFAEKGGQLNPFFLSPEVFVRDFLNPLECIKEKVGVLIFEFSNFKMEDYVRGRDFIVQLDNFLGSLPVGWRYAVEVRNRSFLHPDYFAMLRQYGIAHVFTSWTKMPKISDQWAMPEAMTADFVVARLLLQPGMSFEAAGELFEPFEEIRSPYPEGVEAAARMLLEMKQKPAPKRCFVYMANRLEGNSLMSLLRVLEKMRG
ncbi:MAG TPA: DUF72 domain-containing protein [Verrucomicrobiae bacterium]